MHFSLIDYLLWFASPLLQAGVLIVLFRRGLYWHYPYFFSYIVLQVASITFLLAAQHSASLYIYGYWVIDVLSILISLAIFREVFKDVFRPYEALHEFSDILFNWSAWMLLLVGCLWAITSIHYGHSSIADVVHLANWSVRLMQCGLGFFVLLVGKYLGISRRHILYGIALGFGMFTSTNMLMAMGMSHPNLIHASAYWRTNLAACDLAALIWLGYTALGTTAD